MRVTLSPFPRQLQFNIQHFYMCASGTHPLGEVTGAQAILNDLQRVAV